MIRIDLRSFLVLETDVLKMKLLDSACLGKKLEKADTSRRGDSDSSSMMRSAEEDGEDNNNCLGGETSWAVPQIQSPPTASGLNWPKHFHHHSVFVPDITSSTPYTGSSPNQRVGKRRRRF